MFNLTHAYIHFYLYRSDLSNQAFQFGTSCFPLLYLYLKYPTFLGIRLLFTLPRTNKLLLCNNTNILCYNGVFTCSGKLVNLIEENT